MDSIHVVIGDVIPSQATQVSFVQNDYVIEQLATATCDPTLGHSILPRTRRADQFWGHPGASQEIGHFPAIFAVAIQNHVSVRTGFRKCFSELLSYPGARWIFRDVEMEDLASTVFDDKKTI